MFVYATADRKCPYCTDRAFAQIAKATLDTVGVLSGPTDWLNTYDWRVDVGIPYPNSDTMDPTVGYGGITFGDHPWGINETDAIGLFGGVKSLKMNLRCM